RRHERERHHSRNTDMRRRFAPVIAFVVVSTLTAGVALAYPWPVFHRDQTHSGVSPETFVSTANASTLGVAWQQNTGAVVQASPVVAKVASLGKSLVFVGNVAGKVSAYDAITGQRRWVFSAG